MTDCNNPTRRDLLRQSAIGAAAVCGLSPVAPVAATDDFRLNYIVGSSMYGTLPIAEVLAEVHKCGAEWIDIWPQRHANHREQIEEMGDDAFKALLVRHNVKVGIYTCFNPGLFKCAPHMKTVKAFGGSMIVANLPGPKGLEGDELKAAMKAAAEQLKPIVEQAEALDVHVAVENHSGSLMNSPQSQRLLLEMIPSKHLGIALAPYHLPQDAKLLARLITDLGERLKLFYAWQHGMGCMTKLPKEQELLQLPGRGDLDFAPLVAALKKINYREWTEIFMHPVPRGIPIMPTAKQVTELINESRAYLDECVKRA